MKTIFSLNPVCRGSHLLTEASTIGSSIVKVLEQNENKINVYPGDMKTRTGWANIKWDEKMEKVFEDETCRGEKGALLI